MRIITLLTDWHNDDYYKAIVKAKLLSQVSDVQFVDVTHKAEHYHISKAAFLLESAISQFPKGTIHFFGIQTVSIDLSKVIVGKYNDQYVIANDNGIFNVLNLRFDELISVNFEISNFPVADCFVPIAIDIHKGKALTEIGESISQTLKYNIVEAIFEDDKITCPVSYIDSYGNLILKLRKEVFEKERKSRRFDIFINSFKYKTDKISEHYNLVPKTEIFAIFNSVGWLEIGMRMANISQILSLSDKSSVIIKFYE